MTLLELSVVIGIVGTLLGLSLLLAKHVEAITKIRRAQAELAMWHESLNRWFVQFGEYPSFDMRLDPERNDTSRICDKAETTGAIRNLENVASNACVIIEGISKPIFFSEYIVGAPNTRDPWGTPYLYIPADEDPDDTVCNPRINYQLLSCGPDNKSRLKGDKQETERDDVYFDH